MRFLTRSLAGVLIFSLTLGLLALAVNSFYQALQVRDAEAERVRPARERVFAVTVETLAPGTAVPVILAYGEVASRRSLEIRAEAPGRVLELAEAFRDGGEVTAGEVLLRIDPADAQATLDLARAERAEAEAQQVEAETSLELAAADLDAAQQSRLLRARALDRQTDIQARGAGTAAAVEEAEIALAAADQAVVGRRQALAQAEAARDLAAILVERRAIAVREAERTLTETVVTAPFDGFLSAAAAVPGAMMGSNEAIGTLTDMRALEVAFRMSNAQYARLRDTLRGTRIEAVLALDDIPISVAGTVERAGAEVGDGQTGRILYARLDGPGIAALRPGDFMTVTIAEPALRNVAVIPAAAVNAAGEMLVLGGEDRLEAARVTVLRRQGDEVIVTDVPAGREFVRERSPQLGAGVLVRPLRPGEEPTPQAETAALDLDPERRAKLIAFVQGNTRMPAEVKARLLAQLGEDRVPAQVVERLERRMGG